MQKNRQSLGVHILFLCLSAIEELEVEAIWFRVCSLDVGHSIVHLSIC